MPKKKLTQGTAKNEPWVEIVRDEGVFHWRLWSGNGKPLAENAEPYADRKACLQAVKLTQAAFALANVVAIAGEDE